MSELIIHIVKANSDRFAAINLDANSGGLEYSKMIASLIEDDKLRESFMRACLTKMGLVVMTETSTVPILSTIHLSSLHNIEVTELLEKLQNDMTREEDDYFLKGENDTFVIEKNNSYCLKSLHSSLPQVNPDSKDKAETDQLQSGQDEKNIDYDKVMKHLIFHESGWPDNKDTPHFNHNMFYSSLADYQEEKGSRAEDFGKLIMYGEVVTSTNTLLEKCV